MTLDGTNTWVLREPGASRSIVVDPGPIIDEHLDAVAEVAGQVEYVLLTHHHLDHSEAARSFAERMGCGVRALEPSLCWRSEPVVDGERLTVDGLQAEVLTTPGHTSDSISVLLGADRSLLTGDMVLGRGTTVVVHPDGVLAEYFDSLDRMRGLVTDGRVASLWPAHGPVLPDAGAVLDHYLVHRRDRLAQVLPGLLDLRAELLRVLDFNAIDEPRALIEDAGRVVEGSIDARQRPVPNHAGASHRRRPAAVTEAHASCLYTSRQQFHAQDRPIWPHPPNEAILQRGSSGRERRVLGARARQAKSTSTATVPATR
jgi:glyoxylase-like metal-dependent hydrolase (beta-lactamase superfamily II)